MNLLPLGSRSARRARRNLPGLALVAALALVLAGCGSGSSPASSTSATGSGPAVSVNSSVCNGCGSAVVSLTDAPGDFVSYLVKVDSISLKRSDGTTVQIVPVATQVDFAQLVNLSEVLGAQEIPSGTYSSAQMTLDYGNATIVVSTASGNVTVAAADLIDGGTGAPISAPLTVTLSFGSNPLVISDGAVSSLALDFNLAASDSVDLTASPVTVTVNPVLTASLTPATTKQIHVRGTLSSVSTANSNYVISVDPFDDQQQNFGQLTVQTTSNTQFWINGTSYTGSAGLSQLATLAADALTTAYGTWNGTSNTFTASVVHAGTSITLGDAASSNGVDGIVTARTGNTLTLGNVLVFGPQSSSSGTGSNSSSGEDMRFQQQVTVTVGSGTTVTELGQGAALSITAISVGQKARFTGTLTTSSSGVSLDATSGSALLEPTEGLGLLTSSATGSVTLTLQSLGHVPAGGLDFTGTGSGGAQDASAAAYVVGIPASFSTGSLAAGEPVQFSGFVTPFGSAPPDFSADAVVSYTQANADLKVQWTSPGANSPFTSLASSGISIGQAMIQTATTHTVEIGDNSIDISTLTGGITVVPAPSGTSAAGSSGSSSDGTDSADQGFAIAHAGSDSVDSYSSFASFVTALTTDLASATVMKVSAQGSYDGNGTLTATHVAVTLNK